MPKDIQNREDPVDPGLSDAESMIHDLAEIFVEQIIQWRDEHGMTREQIEGYLRGEIELPKHESDSKG